MILPLWQNILEIFNTVLRGDQDMPHEDFKGGLTGQGGPQFQKTLKGGETAKGGIGILRGDLKTPQKLWAVFPGKIRFFQNGHLCGILGVLWPKMGPATGLFPYYQKTAPRIFLISCMKLGAIRGKKVTKSDFCRKIPKSRFWAQKGHFGTKNTLF